MRPERILPSCIIILSLACASCRTTTPPHTRFSTPNKEQRIWTYLNVNKIEIERAQTEVNEHLQAVLDDAQIYILDGNISVYWTGSELHVGSEVIDHSIGNLFIRGNGEIQLNGFIRTYK